MKALLIFFLAILITSNVHAQTIVKGTIIDAENESVLAYVNVGLENSKKGTVSDENGNFEIELNQNDVIVFSYLGYETEKIKYGKQGFIIAKLEAMNFKLEEIQISNSAFDKEVLLGARNEKKRGKSIGFGNAQLGTELGALIEIKKETFVKNVNFVLNHAKGDSLLLRINMYDYSEGFIGDKILKHNIIIKEEQRKGVYTIDLQDYELILFDNILISIEWLRDFDEAGNKLITFDTKKSRKLAGTFIRTSKTSEFIRLPVEKKYKPCIYLIGNQSSN